MPAQIRLKRVGRKKQPSFRIVVADSSTAVTGPAIEELGLYHPRTSPTFVRLDAERTLQWLHDGAMPTDTVRSILRKAGLWQKYHEGLRPGQLPAEAREIVMGPAEGRMGTSARASAASDAPTGSSGQEAATAVAEPALETGEAGEEAGEDEEPEASAGETESGTEEEEQEPEASAGSSVGEAKAGADADQDAEEEESEETGEEPEDR